MADEPDTTTIKDQYAARVTADLEANQQDQSRIRAELDALKGRLEALERDHGLLQTMHHTLSGTSAAAGKAAPAGKRTPAKTTPVKTAPVKTASSKSAPSKSAPSKAASSKADTAKSDTARTVTAKTTTSAKSAKTAAPARVPTPRSKKTEVTSEVTATAASSAKPAPKPARTPRKNAAPAKTASRGRAETSAPSLRDVVLGLFAGHQEPRTVADILAELTTAHPDRGTSPQVVRNTLEALVAKGRLERERKQGSVFYTAPDQGTAGTPTADAVPATA